MEQKKQTWVLVLAAVAVALVNASFLLVEFIPGIDAESVVYKLLFVSGLVLLVALGVIALFFHNKKTLDNPVRERQTMLIIKLGLVPFYCFGAYMIIGLIALSVLVLPLAIVVFVCGIAGWFIMLPGSVWAICYALSMKKAGMISGGVAALFIVMQFFFVLDVIAALAMFFLGRSHEKAARAGV